MNAHTAVTRYPNFLYVLKTLTRISKSPRFCFVFSPFGTGKQENFKRSNCFVIMYRVPELGVLSSSYSTRPFRKLGSNSFRLSPTLTTLLNRLQGVRRNISSNDYTFSGVLCDRRLPEVHTGPGRRRLGGVP